MVPVSYCKGPFTRGRWGGGGNDETPAGEGARRDPTGSETTAEAHLKGGSTKVTTSCGNVDRPYVV